MPQDVVETAFRYVEHINRHDVAALAEMMTERENRRAFTLRWFHRTVVFALLLCIMALTASCGITHESDPLDGTHWSLVSLQGQRLIDGTRVTLHFADGFVQGFAGCNDYRPLIIDSDDEIYQYQITREDPPIEGTAESGALTIPNFIITDKDCPSPEGVMQQEQVYVETLRDAAAYRIINERLEIDNAQGDTILVFTWEDK
jgi:heat shock protein HslJ